MSEITERTKVVNTNDTLKQASILKNALKIALGTILSRVLGLLREVLLAFLFDRTVTDAWSAAFRIPNFFRRLLNEGAFSLSLIPAFVKAKTDSHQKAQNLINIVYLFVLLVSSVLTLFAISQTEMIMRFVLDEQFVQQTAQFELTCRLAKIMFGFIFFASQYAFALGILNALEDFFWPAFAPMLLNLCMIIATIWPFILSSDRPIDSEILAWGVFWGGFLQMVFLFYRLHHQQYLPKLYFNLNQFAEVSKDFKRMVQTFIPGFLAVGYFQILILLNLKFSSSLESGTLSSFQYVDRLIELPLSLVAVALSGSLLSSLAQSQVEHDQERFSQKAFVGLDFNFFFMFISAFLLSGLAEPIVDLLFARGQFNQQDVLRTAFVLKYYAWIMIFIGASRLLTSALFVSGDTKVPIFSCLFALTLHVLIMFLMKTKISIEIILGSSILSSVSHFSFLMYGMKSHLNRDALLIFIKRWVLYGVIGFLMMLVSQTMFKGLNHFLSLSLSLALCALIDGVIVLSLMKWLFPVFFIKLKSKFLGAENV